MARINQVSLSKSISFNIYYLVIIDHMAKVSLYFWSGFISLDCGLPVNSSYTEPITGINYISDATFIDTGVSMSISPVYKTISLEQEYYYVRSFPQGTRNCYTISLTSGTR